MEAVRLFSIDRLRKRTIFSGKFLVGDHSHTNLVCMRCCLKCTVNTEIHYCDGSTSEVYDEHAPCTHFRGRTILSFDGEIDGIRTVKGRAAANMMRDLILPSLRDPEKSKLTHPFLSDQLLDAILPPNVKFQHIDTCIHGAQPACIIHGADGVFKSIFIRRCNGEYVNALGEVMRSGNDEVDDDDVDSPGAQGMTSVDLALFEEFVRGEGLDEEVIAEVSCRMRNRVDELMNDISGGKGGSKKARLR